MRVLFRRVASGVAAVALSTGLLAGTAGPASAAGCTTSFGTYSTVRVGKTGAQARAVECLLHDAGYRTSRNASFSSGDAAKLKNFQSRHAISSTGRTSNATWAALIARGSTPTLERGDRGADVKRLQLSLRALGHHELKGTGYFGTQTVAAVKSVQGHVGQARTGRARHAFWFALQHGAPAKKHASSTTRTATSSSSSSSRGDKALAFAKKQLGDGYSYGSAGPNRWDCSGLTMKSWAAAGTKLPHSAKGQFRVGKSVKKSDLRKGDLVFFYSGPSHVAIYAGGGKVIHAPNPRSKVSYIKMSYMPFKGARRPA